MESQIQPMFAIMIGIGALLMVLAIVVYFMMRRSPDGEALFAMGTVVDQEEEEDDGVTYSPIVKFTARDGTDIIFTDAISTSPALFKVGEQVKVRYDSSNFHNARIAGTMRAHLLSIVLFLLGVIVSTIGLVMVNR